MDTRSLANDSLGSSASLFSFMLGAALFATLTTHVSTATQDDACRSAAIRAHIESIFQAFINKDAAALRATPRGKLARLSG